MINSLSSSTPNLSSSSNASSFFTPDNDPSQTSSFFQAPASNDSSSGSSTGGPAWGSPSISSDVLPDPTQLSQTAAPATASASTGSATGTSGTTATTSASGSSTQDVAATLAGYNTQLPSPTDTAPAGMTVDDINKLDGGLLGNLGNQDLQGQGGIKDLLSKDPNVNGDISTDPNAAWRAYSVLVAVKNETNSDGSTKPDSAITNGKIGGWTSQGFGHGSEGGDLQDYLLHGRVPSQLPQGDHTVGANGSTASGAQNIANSIKDGFEKFGNDLKTGFENFGKAIVNLGKDIGNGFKNFGSMVINGLDGVGDAITGNSQGASADFNKAKNNAEDLGDNIVDAGKNLGTIAETAAPLVLAAIPGVGDVAAGAMVAGEAVADTAGVAVDAAAEAGTEAGSSAASSAATSASEAGTSAGSSSATSAASSSATKTAQDAALDMGKEFGKNSAENLAQDIANPNQPSNNNATPAIF